MRSGRDTTPGDTTWRTAERALIRAFLFRPSVIRDRLDELRRTGTIDRVPNEWQVTLGVVRMLHRVVFRSETVGTSTTAAPRTTWRARWFAFRPLRTPFLLRERAIAPLDLSGLLSSPERVVRHLLCAHHDGNQFAYDLEMLLATPDRLLEVLIEARAIATGDDARSEFVRDLCVYEGYHASLALACERAMHRDFGLDDDEAGSPDVSFAAYLAWCAAQPTTLEETAALLRRRAYHPMHGWA